MRSFLRTTVSRRAFSGSLLKLVGMNPVELESNGRTQVFGLEVLSDAEQQLRVIRDNLRVAQSRHKSYADTTEEN